MAKFERYLYAAIFALVLMAARHQAIPVGTATFPNLGGNMTFTPTNGFGTFVSGAINNLTCNNPLGNIIPGNPLVGNSSIPCRVGMTIHNLINGTTGAMFRQFPNWEQIFGGTFPPTANNNAQCGNVGNMFNPTNSLTNPAGFLGNMEVFNGTGRFVAGPFNFTLGNYNPLSVLNLPVVIWKDALNKTANLANQPPNPARILSCSFIRLTQM